MNLSGFSQASIKSRIESRLYKFYRGLREVFRYRAINAVGMQRYRRSGVDLRAEHDRVAVSYLTSQYPLPPVTRRGIALGGAGKMTYLTEHFPHSYPSCSILYVENSIMSRPMLNVVRAARKKGIRIVVNQNGVYHPALYEFNCEIANRVLTELYMSADYVFYQSRFSIKCAERYLGNIDVPHSILFSPVDTDHFKPQSKAPPALNPVLLSIASPIYRFHRIEMPMKALAILRKIMPGAKLIIPGYNPRQYGARQAIRRTYEYAKTLGLPPDAIELLPPYTKKEAPGVLNRAHMLIHISQNDCSPALVAEAMSCGLPIVYLASGGVPELAGDAAGIGIPSELNWEKVVLPDPAQIVEAVVRVAERWEEYSAAARERASTQFHMRDYIASHRAVFNELMAK
jgi:glycosyltransferase involved in cell wall biosynthesis